MWARKKDEVARGYARRRWVQEKPNEDFTLLLAARPEVAWLAPVGSNCLTITTAGVEGGTSVVLIRSVIGA